MENHNSIYYSNWKWNCIIIKHSKTILYPTSLLVITLIFLLCVVNSYAQEEVGDISGNLFDKQSNEPIINHPVTLNIHKAGDVTQQETTTDDKGGYRFENLSIDFTTHYSISTTYNDIEYIEKELVLSSLVPNLVVDINIGGITDDTSNINIKAYTIVIGLPPEDHPHQGAMSIIEAFDVENKSDLPFQTTHNDQQVGFYLPLPQDHEEFQTRAPSMLKINATKDHVILTEPLQPGLLQIGFTYVYHAIKDQLDISRSLPFNIKEIAIFIPEFINLIPTSSSFKPVGRQQIHTAIYTIYKATPEGGFEAGASLELGLKLPKEKSNIGQLVFIAVAAALAGGFLVAAIFTLRNARRGSEVTTDVESSPTDTGWLRKLTDEDLEHARTTRLEIISRLEEMQESDEISDRVIIDSVKSRLIVLLKYLTSAKNVD